MRAEATATTLPPLSLHDALPIYAFMLTGMFTEKGKTYVRYRYDDKPGDDSRGDEEEEIGEIFKAADGRYSLVSDRRSEEHTSELQPPCNLVCRHLLEKENKKKHG